MATDKRKIFIVAGEASGDLHGANLIHHLRERSAHPLEIYGVGGEKIRQTGALEFYDLAHFHVTGISAALKRLPEYRKASKIILESIRRVRPDLVVFIDNPGFNLHLAKELYGSGIPMVYFIAPQVWAWGSERVVAIKKYMKKVLVVFEFEKKFFEKHGVRATWVGHPLKDFVQSELPENGSAPAKNTIGRMVTLLPGSRKGELKTLFPILLGAAKYIRNAMPATAFSVIKAPTMPREVYESRIKKMDFPVQIVEKYAYHAIHESDLAIACSGTVTLESAILGTPVIITNRGSILTYLAAKALVKVDCLGLPNLILGEKKFPEFLQYDATPKKIASEAIRILTEKDVYAEMKNYCEEVSRLIGEKGASVRAADEILAELA